MRILLAPLGLLFSVIHQLRRWLYERGVLRARRLSKPVISVGNLTVGGTGKTPFVDVLLTQLESRGLKCCVLSRGYGRESSKTLLVNPATPISEGGDEPLWLYQRHPQAKIALGADRVQAAQLAGDVDIFILDDGLQHLDLHRDFEITLIDATRPLWHYNPLPWGYGRDGFDVLRRSDLVVITRSNQAKPEDLDQLADKIFEAGVLDLNEASLEKSRWVDLKTGQDVDSASGAGKKAILISAIGNPESFETLAKESQLNVVFHEKKADHYNYGPSDIAAVEKKAMNAGAELIVTTEKDAVKIRPILASENDSGGKHQPFSWITLSTKMTFDPELPNIYDLVSHSSH